MNKQYSHRNGDPEPPTEFGRFWCRGPLFLDNEEVPMSNLLTVAPWHDNSMLVRLYDGRFVTIHNKSIIFPLGDWSGCLWWGPEDAPWETEAR